MYAELYHEAVQFLHISTRCCIKSAPWRQHNFMVVWHSFRWKLNSLWFWYLSTYFNWIF